MTYLDTALPKVLTPRAAKLFEALGPRTVGQLLRYYPRRYQEPGTLTDVSGLAPGEHVTVMGTVISATIRPMRARQGFIMTVLVGGSSGATLELTFFAKSRGALRSHESRLVPGNNGLFTGVVAEYRGTRQLTHPDYELYGSEGLDEQAAIERAQRPIPVYGASAKLPTWRIAASVEIVLGTLQRDEIVDPIPESVRQRRGLPDLYDALKQVHQPANDRQWQVAQHRLRFEEAFVLQGELARRRAAILARNATSWQPRPRERPGILAAFDERLPFQLTGGQMALGEQLAEELTQAIPMLRLLQGDVGSGKTVVALRAMLQVVDAGGQAALLAPTEVLAVQHARSIKALLGDLAEDGFLGAAEASTRVALLTGSLGAKERRQALLDAASGAAGIVIGTHALLSETVQFADLGLVVVDEQHRFGVEQRDALRTRSDHQPHVLVMTATPIPRTVAMTVFGDLAVSTLDELPQGRMPTTTHVVPADNVAWMARVWSRVREEVAAGRRAYVVCARIRDTAAASGSARAEASDTVLASDVAEPADFAEDHLPGAPPRDLRAVEEVLVELQSMPALAGVRIAALHGQMSAADKDAVMTAFATGEVEVLVATTVIEVGVDVPQASAMVVLDADRFGISQLHQLRGRVGRGSDPGICLLVSSAEPESIAEERLKALASTTDGFVLAQKDLELRREGDVLSGAQSGRSTSLRLLRVLKDATVIEQARDDVVEIVAHDPELRDHPALAAAIDEALRGREEFIDRV